MFNKKVGTSKKSGFSPISSYFSSKLYIYINLLEKNSRPPQLHTDLEIFSPPKNSNSSRHSKEAMNVSYTNLRPGYTVGPFFPKESLQRRLGPTGTPRSPETKNTGVSDSKSYKFMATLGGWLGKVPIQIFGWIFSSCFSFSLRLPVTIPF